MNIGSFYGGDIGAQKAADTVTLATINSVYFDPATFWSYAVFDGGIIPSDSIMYYEDGSHITTDNSAVLIVTGTPWTIDEWVGFKVRNTSDGSEGIVTANTTNQITATLAGGTDNDWDIGDTYEIVMNIDTNDQIDYETTTDIGGRVSDMSTKGVPTITGASGSHSFDVKYRDATDSKVSSTVTVTVTV